MSSAGNHLDDLERLGRQNPLRREILDRDDVTVFSRDDDRSVGRRNEADPFVRQ